MGAKEILDRRGRRALARDLLRLVIVLAIYFIIFGV